MIKAGNGLKLKDVDVAQARLAQALGLLTPLRLFLAESPNCAATAINGDSLWAIEELLLQAQNAAQVGRA